MRSLLKVLAVVPITLALFLVVASSAVAQTYTVTRTDDPNPAPCEPANCSLRGALMTANASTSVDDVVVLPASASPYLLQYEFLTFQIDDEVEVRGAGANQTVVKGDGLETVFGIGAGVKATLSGLTITGGQAAIQNNGELLVRGVAIEGNKWNGGTAGIITNGPLTVESSFLGFNRTEAASGGVIHANMPVTIVNSTIGHNTSKEGPGAISVNFGVAVTLTNTALVSNRSETAPMAAVGGAPLTVRNSVFADNRDAAGLRSCESLDPVSSLGGNVSDDSSCGTTATDRPNVNPLLGTLALHGGPTQVYDLLAGSPAIDAASECPAVDQRGVARPQGAGCDSGPYESVPAPVLAPVDSVLSMRLGKGHLFLSRKNQIRIRLTCPANEASPPCAGKVELKSPWLRTLVGGIRDSRPTGRYPFARFTIGAGKAKAVVIRPSKSVTEFLRDFPKPRKVRVKVTAKDAAGNIQTIRARRKLMLR